MMDALSDFHCLRPAWLALLLPALLLWWLQRRHGDGLRRWRAVIDPDLLRHMTVGAQASARISPNAALLGAWTLGIVALAGPTWQREPSPFADAQPPAMIVLRVTPSMQTPDLTPTRLDRARQKLRDLLALREGASTGLIAYSGSAHLVLPPTADADVVSAMAQALAPDVMPDEGDDLAGALALAGSVLAGNRQGGSIVLIADTVAAGEIGKLSGATGAGAPPVSILAMLPPGRPEAETPLQDAARILDAVVVGTTIDQGDIAALERRLRRVGQPVDVTGEGTRWQEAGYWLTPLLALMALAWFRRGWVMAG